MLLKYGSLYIFKKYILILDFLQLKAFNWISKEWSLCVILCAYHSVTSEPIAQHEPNVMNRLSLKYAVFPYD